MSLPAAATSCAHLLAFHFTDEDLAEASELWELRALAGLRRERDLVQDEMARVATRLFPQQLRLATSRGGLKTWELAALRRGFPINRRVWRLRQQTKATAALGAEYDRLTARGVELERRVQLVLLAALDEYAQIVGDTHLADVEAAIERHQGLLELLAEVDRPLRAALVDVETLGRHAGRWDDADRARWRHLPEPLDRVGARLAPTLAAAVQLGIKAAGPREYGQILETYFARDADEWRAHLGPEPRLEHLRFLQLRVNDVRRLLLDVQIAAERQMAELNGRVTETLLRLEDTYIQGREAL